ncbi:hypothetical protein TNIN_497901 [Trichonephila inaurata madagascariensis]|uniref:C2H2-type domain-containing protein n=1 Tax=Trichonephila inaurata madagascariensis TaxID=2747483 RepID=A0A8X7BVW7_9ARAC|nr:hypothetical protein TNIN_497901 [Trichonephila inaurata madagascariensis]
MAECRDSPSEEKLFYFCWACVTEHREPVFTSFISEKPVTCTECPRRFHTGYCSKKRTPAHFCVDCKERFVTSFLLKLHSKGHFGVGPYRCSACLKVFATYSVWEWHTKQRDTIHELRCIKCWKSFQGKVCPGVHYHLVSRYQVLCEECCMGWKSIEYVTP